MNRGSYTVPRVDESSEVFRVRDQRNGQWFWAHNAVIDRAAPHLGAAALAVYFALCRFASAQQASFPSWQTIGDRLGLTRHQVRRCIEKLAAYGLIHVVHTPGRRPNVYVLLDPEAWRLPAGDAMTQRGAKQESASQAEKPAPVTCAETQLRQNAKNDPLEMPMESENRTLAQLRQPDPNGKNLASERGDLPPKKTYQEDKIKRHHHYGAAGAAEGGAGGAGDDGGRDGDDVDLTQILSRLGVTNPSDLIEKAFGHGWTRESLVEAIQRLESTDRVKNKAGFLVKIITEGPQRAEAILNYYDPPPSEPVDAEIEALKMEYKDAILLWCSRDALRPEERQEVKEKALRAREKLERKGFDVDGFREEILSRLG